MKLYDLAKVIRSKNAGPFTLTIDLIFGQEVDFDHVMNSPSFSPATIGELYHTAPGKIVIHPFKKVLAIKVTMPRPISSGAIGDCDVYGSQQHFPLAGLCI
jgi:hypothetical protein